MNKLISKRFLTFSAASTSSSVPAEVVGVSVSMSTGSSLSSSPETVFNGFIYIPFTLLCLDILKTFPGTLSSRTMAYKFHQKYMQSSYSQSDQNPKKQMKLGIIQLNYFLYPISHTITPQTN